MIFCFSVEDLERNNGRDKPYFMSKKLMKLLNAKNVKTDVHPDGDVEMEPVETVQSWTVKTDNNYIICVDN